MSESDWAYRDTVACRLCDSVKLTLALDLGETPLANDLGSTKLFPLEVMRCDDCGHHQLSISVNPALLWGPNYPYQSGTSPVFRKHLEALADEVAALKPGGRVLEIASNDGTLCNMLYNRNMRVVGIDPSAAEDRQQMGVSIVGSWPDQEIVQMVGKGERDVIIALNVFAHVDDLHSFTAAVKEALAPDGVFIVEVGYLGSPHLAIWDTIYHEHLSYHDLTSLWPFFNRHGLAIHQISFNESQGDSVRMYVRHIGQTESKAPGPGSWTEGFSQLSWRKDKIKLTSAGLQLALANADSVAGYGCPAKLTTLMYATGLAKQRDSFTCIYDDNPLKVGKLTPGTLIPIVPSANLVVDAPDTLILFAWNFASEIIPRLRAQGYKGRIITPLPEVEVDEL